MRRSASEIIRNLEMRIARLESKKASHNTVYTVAKNEVDAVKLLSKKMKAEDIEIVLLNIIYLHLGPRSSYMFLQHALDMVDEDRMHNDEKIERIGVALVSQHKVDDLETLGRILAQYCRDHAPRKERSILKILKSIGISVKEYDLNVLDDILKLLYPNFDIDSWGMEIGNYKSISLVEDEEENDWGDHGFDYEYGSIRGYHSQIVERVVIRTAKVKSILSFAELDNEKMVDLHPDFDFIVDLIDLNQFDLEHWNGADWAYELSEEQENLGSYDWEIEDIKWGSVSLKNGKLYFFVEWEVCSESEEEEEEYFNEPDDFDPWV